MKPLVGFTLIELLVVVAVMGLIAGLSLGPIAAGRRHGRDAKRKADINLIAQAVDLAWAEKKVLPNESQCAVASSYPVWPPALAGQIAPYLPRATVLPIDPINSTAYHYSYTCDTTRQTFTLTAVLENPNDLDGLPIDSSKPALGRKYEVSR